MTDFNGVTEQTAHIGHLCGGCDCFPTERVAMSAIFVECGILCNACKKMIFLHLFFGVCVTKACMQQCV